MRWVYLQTFGYCEGRVGAHHQRSNDYTRLTLILIKDLNIKSFVNDSWSVMH